MWELDHKKGCVPKNRYFQIVALEKTLESLLDSKEIKPVNPKGNQPWIFIGRTDAEAEAPILWQCDAKSQLIGKDPDTGKDWGQEKKAATDDEMVGWHYRLTGHESGQSLGDGEGQGSLACCSPCACVLSSFSRVRLFVTPWIAARQASLYFTISWSLLKLMSHWVSDTIQPSHPLLSPFLSALSLSQHEGLYQWISSSHQATKVLELQLQHQSFQWIFKVDLL